jgi:ATPase subunit of ABC transporter with duplicated ATPase domains
MITLNNLTKSHGARTLFRDASIQFNSGKRYGLVGANGSGKSTILRLISGEEEPSSGTVSVPKKARLGVLEQDHFRYENDRILDVVMMGNKVLWEAMVEKEKVLANAADYFDADRYAELEDIVLAFDGYALEAVAGEILEGLNIPTEVHQQPLSTLSGGFKLRVLLAQTLASNPDILLLDEPTNHLDILSIRWLEKFLLDYAGCALVVSHDRRFLDSVCTHIVDVDYERVTLYTGNYEDFEEAKKLNRDRKEAEIAKQEQQVADHQAFIDRFKAKASKARQAQSKVKQLEKIVIEDLPQSSRRYPTFRFRPNRQTGKEVLRVEGISKAYGDKHVLNDVSFRVQRGDRLAIIGPNGIGKSTLLKIAMSELAADKGSIEWGHETYPGYFSQDHHELESATGQSILDWLWAFRSDQGPGYMRGKLAEVLFSREDVLKKVENLSGGEAARLVFAKLNVTEPNVLILDEPTNHLDLEGIESLAEGLAAYEGTIVFVSHDRWFVSSLATRILEITPYGIEDFHGSYADYLQKCGDDHLDAEAVIEKARKKA